MGDTGSLTIGGIIAVIAIAVRKEWLIPVCGVFFCRKFIGGHASRVILNIQEKNRRRTTRFLKCRHCIIIIKRSGYHESKIVTRFWIHWIFY